MTDQERKPNGNLLHLGDDQLPVQDVGEWAEEKHIILQRYIEASSGPRSKFVTSQEREIPLGGAAYIDLFAGPGRARIRETGKYIPGSPLLALQHERNPFTKAILVDLDSENVDALRTRTTPFKERVAILQGDCNAIIDEVVRIIPEHGLNMALIDPYGLRPLQFETIKKLASVKRMDLIIHFPTGDIKRNLTNMPSTSEFIDRFLGTTTWRPLVKNPADVPRLIDVFRTQLQPFGYEQEQVRALPISNSKNAIMYHLVYVSKHPKGSKIWTDITKHTVHGQRGFGFN